MQNAENKSKKFVVLATYVVAVLCLIAGLFVPLFNGNEILVLKLANVLKSVLQNGEILYGPVSLFGIEKLTFDFTSLVILLYVFVTALALLAFIPVALSIRKEGKLATGIYYGVEISAVIVLSLFVIVTLQYGIVNYNMVIALSGTAVALIVLCILDKSKTTALKIVLFLLSAIGFIALFDIALFSEKFASPFSGKLSSALVGDGSGALGLNQLFADNIKRLCEGIDAKNKALIIFTSISPTAVLINFFIDTVKISMNRQRKAGRIFNIARYGLAFLSAVCLLITALICKTTIGVMLIAILAVSAIQLAIVTIGFVISLSKKHAEAPAYGAVEEHTESSDAPAVFGSEEPVTADGYGAADYSEEQPYSYGEEIIDAEPSPAPAEEAKEEPADDDDGYISPEEDALAHREEQTETSDEEVKPAEEEIDYEIKTDGTYLLPADEDAKEEPADKEEPVEEITEEPAEEFAEVEPEPIEEPVTDEPVVEITEEPAEEVAESEPEIVEEPVVAEPVDEVAEEPAVTEEVSEPAEEVSEPVEEVAEAEEKPFVEEPKPYNPYERHNNNPFRAYEQSSHPVQPYNPYQTRPAQTERLVQPARPIYEQKPVQTYRPYEASSERPPLRPRPIIQEFKPVPPLSEQQYNRPVYTRDRMYTGPIDDFIRKLSNDERIEFAQTFLEKSNGPLGSIPDYVVGGDNKKFFSLSFIYLGRVRGLVSDGLLNKMYKELNML